MKRWHSIDQRVRFLAVGVWNTVFAYGIYVAAVAVFGKQAYWWLLVPVNAIAVTQNFFAYRWLVFPVRGTLWAQYVRFCIVYLPLLAANLVVVPAFVQIMHINPLVAQGVFIVLMVTLTYLGHKYFTFKEPADVFDEDAPDA